jgi:hypothetical protein
MPEPLAEDLPELGVVERLALHADENGLLGQRDTGRVGLGEERAQGVHRLFIAPPLGSLPTPAERA